MKRIKIANIPIDLFTFDSLNNSIGLSVKQTQKFPTIFLHANAYLVELANTKEQWLKEYFNSIDFVICDGSGIQLAARITGQKIPEKIPFNIWIWKLAKYLSDNSISLYLLGSDIKTINKAKQNLKDSNPNLDIRGHHHGYFNKEINHDENNKIIEKINNSSPDVLIVGFGMPIQESWVKENMDRLKVKAIITCGGGFDFVAGNKPVAPTIFRKLYLEWLFRFLLEPKRLFKRATLSNYNFLKLLFKQNSANKD